MKKKIYKVLGIVLTMAIVLTTCLCAMTATHAETAVTLVQGTIDGGVIKDGAANRAYTKDLISIYDNVSVTIASGYKAAYHLYDYQGNWIKYIGSWQEGTMKTTSLSNYDINAFYFRIVIGASASNAIGDNANFKVADLPADVITFEANPQDTVNGFVITPALVSGTVSGRASTNLNTSIQTHATRLYPINIYEVAEIESLAVAEGHRVYVHYYGADGVWVGGEGWKTGTYKIGYNGATYFRVTYDTASGSGNPAVDGLTLKMYAKDITVDGATTPVMISGNIISAQDGKILGSTNRVYTKNEYAVADYEKVTIADGYRMVVHFWDADGAYIGETGWQTGTRTLKSLPNGANATYFRIVAGDSANSDPFKPEDFPAGTLKLVLAPKDVYNELVISPALVSGTINGAGTTVDTCLASHATRLATYNTYKVEEINSITVGDGCRVFVQFFKEDGSYNDGSGWQTKGTYLVSKLKGATGATYFRITFDSADGSTTPPVSGLKLGAISQAKVEGNILYPAMAMGGTVNGGEAITLDNCVGAHAIRLYTYDVLKVADIESITVPANCRAFIHFFNEDGSYNGPQGWITTGTQKLSNMTSVKNGATQFQVTFDSANGATTPSIEGFYFTLHVYDNDCDSTCNNCDVTRVPAHVYENYTSNNDATCTANGTETGTCACGATDTREVADSKLDHTYVDYTSNNDATCTADGTKTGTCSCGATDTIVDEGSMLAHTFENYTSNDDATCTADGTKTGTCACGATDTIVDEDSALGHLYTTGDGLWCERGCGYLREVEYTEEDVLEIKLDEQGVARLYVNGATSVEGLFKVDGKYYVATWGGYLLDAGKTYVSRSYCDIAANKSFYIGEDGALLDGFAEFEGTTYLFVNGRKAAEGLYKVDGNLYIIAWDGQPKVDGRHYAAQSFVDGVEGYRNFTVDENGVVLDGLVETADGKLFYDKGTTVIPGLYEFEGDLYVVTWGGVVKESGTYFVVNSYCDVEAGRDFVVGEDGIVLNGLVEIEGELYVYDNGITVAPGEYEFDGVIYNVTWGGLVVAE